jgi:type 1 glutamine amidotransferase
MKGVTLIVQAVTMGSLSGAQEKGLLDAVRDGAGLAGWHCGLADSFRSNPAYEFMVGGSFAAHPGGIIDYDVSRGAAIDHEGRPTSRCAQSNAMLVDPNVEVLATTTFKRADPRQGHGDAGRVEELWKGRVFCHPETYVASDFGRRRREIQARMLGRRGPGAGDNRNREPCGEMRPDHVISVPWTSADIWFRSLVLLE